MRITLHDNIHSSAGSAHPALRPSLGNAARAPWARAMHQFLERLPREGGTFVADADADVATIRVRAGRHGDAVWAVWSVAPADEVVAASVLLRGAAPPDDDAAIQSMRDAAPALPFGPADFSALAAEPRPCLGTMYLDARWYDNARVELAATALALAAIHGPDGRLSVEGEPTPPPAATPRAVEPRAGPWSEKRQDGLKFNFTRERLQRVMGMVAKKGSAAIGALPGVHFRVYPPREFLDRPGVLRGRDIFDKLSGTDWWIRWYDDRYDRLVFGDLLGFIDQVAESERAFARSVGREIPASSPAQNSAVWGGTETNRTVERQPVRVNQTLDARRLVRDENVRRLFDLLVLEPAPLPPPLPDASA